MPRCSSRFGLRKKQKTKHGYSLSASMPQRSSTRKALRNTMLVLPPPTISNALKEFRGTRLFPVRVHCSLKEHGACRIVAGGRRRWRVRTPRWEICGLCCGSQACAAVLLPHLPCTAGLAGQGGGFCRNGQRCARKWRHRAGWLKPSNALHNYVEGGARPAMAHGPEDGRKGRGLAKADQ
ncbi:hypothetical protein BDP81DRAFT_416174 [Colletotrichum phormii]|uniref:Uncharacterized protein n=1 Tax=Colletotrichum phormii TaxID=359342 RepID=A0AAJ0EMI0_9PEZI|nr:uncharacterized protein BDP81DRAFT_416174 [Colletotrichum phormii]KAK1654634.1 hypothetical protein BDP81DRAFT_416174 [Colletotrichum phormii]